MQLYEILAQLWANLINNQRLGLRLRLKKSFTIMHRGLRLTVIFEFYKYELEAY